MFKLIRQYPKAFALAVATHGVLGVLLVASFDWSPQPHMALQKSTEEEIVQAVAVDEQQVQAEIDRLKRIEEKKRHDEQARINRLEQKAEKARKAREKEQKQLAELERQRKIEAKKKQQAEQERLKIEQEKRRAQLEKEKLDRDRAAAEERKRRAEQERQQAEKLAREAREEAIRMAKEQQRQEEERLRQQQMAEEARRLREQQQADRVAKSTVDKYTILLKQKVEQSWRKPATAKPGMSCTVFVRLSPVGDVLSAKVVKGSGDAVFDRSVETAVFQAAPFDLPKDSAIFSKYFRELKFDFIPDR